MSHEENTTTLTPPTQDDNRSIFDIVGIDPAYEIRMDAAILREHALQDKALLGTLSPAEQQEWDCLKQEIDELEAIILAEMRAKFPRNERGAMVLPTEGRQPYTSEQLYEIIHEGFP